VVQLKEDGIMNREDLRFWEIDFLRGIAIILMIAYHIFYDLNFFEVYDFNLDSILFQIFLFPIGTTFILLVGVSLTLSYNRAKKSLSQDQLIKKFILRGIKIFILGLIITLITFLFLDKGFVIIGVLHCIGISIILSTIFIRYRLLNLCLGILFVIIGIYLQTMTFEFNWLLWLGFIPSNFYTVDYFPLLPWFGIVLIGIFLGNTFYPSYKRKFKIKDFSYIKSVKVFCFLGKNSLLIYFIHQPIIIGLIQLFKFLN